MGYGQTKKVGTKEILCHLRERNGAQILQWATRGLISFQAEEVLLSFLREYEAGGRIPRKFLESEATPQGLLRAMRENKETSRPSCGRESLEQYFPEHSDIVRKLSQLVASRGEPQRVVGSGEVPLLAHRLRGLGNAVVPSQAREAFERLIGIKKI